MENVKIYKCFIASPSDVKEERDICDEVFNEINKTLGEKFRFRVESLRWENASPSISNEPQAVINDELLSKFDIFIGILYCRFGSPTNDYGSGTEEEFCTALRIYEESPHEKEIKMYFNDAPISPSEASNEQIHDVKAFKSLVSESGCLYKVYNGASEFKEFLREDLSKYFLKTYENKNSFRRLEELELKLQNALCAYENQHVTWIDRELCETQKLGETFNDAKKIDILSLVEEPYSAIIEAPPQFGFTCLSHYLILEAHNRNAEWLYLNANNIRQSNIYALVEKECKKNGYTSEDIKCIVLDSWTSSGDGMIKLLRRIVHDFKETPVVVMSARDKDPRISEENIETQRDFKRITLLPLTKNKMRSLVDQNSKIMDTDVVLNKLISDFNTLNIHRTPAHCLMLLKILENPMLGSPINREKMLSMLLSVIFDFAKVPDYSKRADVEHCKFVLSLFCEKMINKWKFSFNKDEFTFSKDEFIEFAKSSMIDQKINIDVHLIFDTLFNNNIIVKELSNFKFKYYFWVNYFSAQRMKLSKKFRDEILANKRYLSFIDMIEFYTGIERSESELIDLLTNDLEKQCDLIESETVFKADIDPLQHLEWEPSTNEIQKGFLYIKKNILNSHLPNQIKDEYADSLYKITTPYDQDIYEVNEIQYFEVLAKKIRVCSRALRNSEFVEPSKKINLLKQITRGWHLFSKLFFIFTPLFVRQNFIRFYGANFILAPEYDQYSNEEKSRAIIQAIPCNVINLFYDDLFSERLSLLFYDYLDLETVKPINHLMVSLLIKGKPENWDKKVCEYIKSSRAKSAHLLDVLISLIHTYKYDYVSASQLAQAKDLIGLVKTKKSKPESKHLLDEKRSLFNRKKSDGIELPKRIFSDDD